MSKKRKASDISKDEAVLSVPPQLIGTYGFIDIKGAEVTQRPTQQNRHQSIAGSASNDQKAIIGKHHGQNTMVKPSSGTNLDLGLVQVVDLDSEDESSEEAEFEVERILSMRSRKHVLQYLVKWKGWTDEHNTWEPEENLTSAKEAISEFHQNAEHFKAQTKAQKSTTQSNANNSAILDPVIPARVDRPVQRPSNYAPNIQAPVFGRYQPQYAVHPAPWTAGKLPQYVQVTGGAAHTSTDPPEIAALKAKVEDTRNRIAVQSVQTTAYQHMQSQVVPWHTGLRTDIYPGPDAKFEEIFGYMNDPLNGVVYLVRWSENGRSGTTWMNEYQLVAAGQQVLLSFFKANHTIISLAERRAIKNSTCTKQKAIPDEISRIMEHREREGREEYLVQWKDARVPSWEPRIIFNSPRLQSLIDAYIGRMRQQHLHGQPGFAQTFAPIPGRGPAGLKSGAVNDPLAVSQQSLVSAVNSVTAQIDETSKSHQEQTGFWQKHLSTWAPKDATWQNAAQNLPVNKLTKASVTDTNDRGASNGSASSLQQPQLKRGRPRKADKEERLRQSVETAQPAAVDIVDLSDDSKSLQSKSNFVTRLERAAAPPKTKSAQPRYLHVIPENKDSGRPLPSGPYCRHTVASNVLLAAGLHPWLAPLNVRLHNLMYHDADNGKTVDARVQHQRGIALQQRLDDDLDNSQRLSWL